MKPAAAWVLAGCGQDLPGQLWRRSRNRTRSLVASLEGLPESQVPLVDGLALVTGSGVGCDGQLTRGRRVGIVIIGSSVNASIRWLGVKKLVPEFVKLPAVHRRLHL
jgi:hypothetical protein